MNKRIQKLSALIEQIQDVSDKEYQRTIQIYEKAEYHEEYKKLLFTGFIQHFSILTLRQLIYVIQSLDFIELSQRLSDKERAEFFQPFYFEKNSLSILDVAWNKLVTIIKFRFSKPDNRLGAEISRVLKQAKKNPDFKRHPASDMISELRGSQSYRNFSTLRGNSDHGYEPKYRNDLYNVFRSEDILYLVDKMEEIVGSIVLESGEIKLHINDSDIEFYKVRELYPPELPSLAIRDLITGTRTQLHIVKELVNINLNILDYLTPWLRKKEVDVSIVDLTFSFVSDICFRANDVFRSFGAFVYLSKGDYILFPEKVAEYMQRVGYDYFMNVACIRLLSVLDKIGLLLSRVFPMPKEKTYFKQTVKWILENADDEYIILKQKCNSMINSEIFKSIDLIRQQYVHGMDLSQAQNEGTVVSSDYILLSIYYNMVNVNAFLDYIILDFYPKEVEKFLYSNYGIPREETMQVFATIRKSINPYMPKQVYE